MTFVLAFGVLGSADAITKFTRGTGDLKTVQTGDEFKVSFSVSLQGPQAVKSGTRRASQAEINQARDIRRGR